MTIFVYKGLTRTPEIGNNTLVWVLPNIWRLVLVRDTKFGRNVSNKMLANATKCQGYSFYRFWIIKKRLQHRSFPLNIERFLRAPISKNICKRLLLPWECIMFLTSSCTLGSTDSSWSVLLPSIFYIYYLLYINSLISERNNCLCLFFRVSLTH